LGLESYTKFFTAGVGVLTFLTLELKSYKKQEVHIPTTDPELTLPVAIEINNE